MSALWGCSCELDGVRGSAGGMLCPGDTLWGEEVEGGAGLVQSSSRSFGTCDMMTLSCKERSA